MSQVHLHLLLTHVPVIATIIGMVILLWAFMRGSDDMRRLALMIFVGAALVGIPVYLTGEGAEDAVEGLVGVSEAGIERHEDAAGLAFYAVEALGVLSLVVLLAARRGSSSLARMAVAPLVLGIAASGMLAWTAYLGGAIRHTEIAAGAVRQLDTQSSGNAAEPEEE